MAWVGQKYVNNHWKSVGISKWQKTDRKHLWQVTWEHEREYLRILSNTIENYRIPNTILWKTVGNYWIPGPKHNEGNEVRSSTIILMDAGPLISTQWICFSTNIHIKLSFSTNIDFQIISVSEVYSVQKK